MKRLCAWPVVVFALMSVGTAGGCALGGSSKATGPLAQGYTAPDIGDVGEGVCPRKVLGCRARAASSDERRNPERDTLAKPPSKCD